MRLNRRHFLSGATAATVLPSLSRAQEETTLRVALGGLPLEKGNPFSNIQTPSILLVGGIFDGLTRLQKDGSVEPWLATSWEARDPLTWIFKLRDDIVFSNGKPFDAGAVVHTVEYLAGPGPQTEGVRRDLRFLAGAKALDKYTVEITTTEPVPMMPRFVAVMLIPEPEAWNTLGVQAFADTPVGTGPLMVDSWEPVRALFAANRSSWRAPSYDKAEFLLLPDQSARLQAILSGRLDIGLGMAPDIIPVIESEGGSIVTTRDGSAACIMLQFQHRDDTPLADVRVRRALNYAVDKQTIVDVLFEGKTVVSSQPAVREAYGYDPTIEPYDYDPDKAKALLTEAGYADGFDMTLETSGGTTNGALVIQRVADDLARIGVQVEIRQKPVMRFLLDFVRGRTESDSFTLIWGSYPLLDVIQTTNINSCRKDQPWYCDENIQPVIEEAWVESEPERAITLRKQIMRYYHEQAPSIFLYENIAFSALSPRTSGFDQIFGFIPFEDIRIA